MEAEQRFVVDELAYYSLYTSYVIFLYLLRSILIPSKLQEVKRNDEINETQLRRLLYIHCLRYQ